MYMSRLSINTGSNPDRPCPGRLWLRNVYRVHQRLCMAFPTDSRTERDPDFLAPYAPDDFPEMRDLADRKKTEVEEDILAHVHRQRDHDAGFLFRIEPKLGGRAVIGVQSAREPNWDYAFHNIGYLLAAPPVVWQFHPTFVAGQILHFRLFANPTRRLSRRSLGPDGQPINANDVGKRVPVQDDNLIDWLVRQFEPCALIDRDCTTIQLGYVYVNMEGKGQGQRLRSVRYDGMLTVTNPDNLQAAIVQGIGSAKGFGFGMLSIAPAR